VQCRTQTQTTGADAGRQRGCVGWFYGKAQTDIQAGRKEKDGRGEGGKVYPERADAR
jgi:hypothetical protein